MRNERRIHGFPAGGRARALAVMAAWAMALALGPMAIFPATAGGYVDFTKDHPMGEGSADTALVYVVRPTSLGAAIKSFFFVDDELAGINRGNSYFFTQVDPGKHVFWSKSENVDALELEVEAGKTYYIQQHVVMGFMRARTKIEVLDDEEGAKKLGKCKKHGTLTEEGRAKGEELVRDHMEDTKEDLERRTRAQADEENGG